LVYNFYYKKSRAATLFGCKNQLLYKVRTRSRPWIL